MIELLFFGCLLTFVNAAPDGATGGGALSQHLVATGPPRPSSLQAPIMLMSGHEGEVYCCRLILMWNIYGAWDFATLKAHSGAVMELHSNTEGSLLFLTSRDKTVGVWESETADGFADVVLSCSLVEEGAGLGGMGGGALFTRTPATLVLRDVPVGPEESLDTLTPFIPPSVPDPDLILFENKVSSPEIPNAGLLLHADCNEQEVMCEISRYTPRGLPESSDPAYFMVSLSVEGLDFSTSLILQTLPVEKYQPTLTQNKLSLPLSQSGTLITKVIFLVFSNINSVSAPLRGQVLLHCGFKQEEETLAPEVGLEWRLQHRGKGRKVLEMKSRLDDTEGATVVHGERKGSMVDAAQVLSEGNVSMSLTELKVVDEGTYICTVNLGPFHAQQVIQLRIIQPPEVSLSEEKLVLKKTPQTLSCHCAKYYPLDAQMEWFFLPPTETEPKLFPHQGSLSSHRQHRDGTFSVSSHLSIPPSISPGTKITCKVSHPALDDPLYISIVLESPPPDSYWWVLGFLVVTVLFFYQVMR